LTFAIGLYAAAMLDLMASSLRLSPRPASIVGPSVPHGRRRHVMYAFTHVQQQPSLPDFVLAAGAIPKPVLDRQTGIDVPISLGVRSA
jgi:hypothetical protein